MCIGFINRKAVVVIAVRTALNKFTYNILAGKSIGLKIDTVKSKVKYSEKKK